jgi:hypothetical protein
VYLKNSKQSVPGIISRIKYTRLHSEPARNRRKRKTLVLTLGSLPKKGEKKTMVLTLGNPPKKGGKKNLGINLGQPAGKGWKKKTLVLTLGNPPEKGRKKNLGINLGQRHLKYIEARFAIECKARIVTSRTD